MNRWLALPLLASLVGSGCADFGEARRAQDPGTRRPGERTISAAEVGLGPGAVLTLEQGVRIALASTPLVGAARARVDEARARLEQIDAGFLPQIAVSANYRWERAGGAGALPLTGQSVGPNSGIVQTLGGSVQLRQLR